MRLTRREKDPTMPPPAEAGEIVTTTRSPDRWFAIILVLFLVPLVLAIFADAALTWDGAFYLFRTLDTGRPFIAHDRLIDAPLHWPVLWVNQVADSLSVLRATFGLVHVITPLASIALSWWVVRREAPSLIVWPIIGIGLATLPGQINFISEGIKAHQLIWPVLLAVLIGLPARTVPLAAMVSLVIMYLHPAAVPIFLAVAGAALVTASLSPKDRERLVPFALSLLFAALLRYGMIGGGYESGEMNLETMKRQWRNSATGLPGIALALTFLLAAAVLASSRLRRGLPWLWTVPVALSALAGTTLTIWALDPSRWWDALEFRGPTNVISLAVAGVAFVDATVARLSRSTHLRTLPDIRRRTSLAIAITFAIVLSIQSILYGQVIDEMNAIMASSDQRCIELGTLPGMPESPLNLWSTPSLSLLYQGWKPDKVVLMDGDCERARQGGTLGIAAPGSSYDSSRIDLVPLQWELGGHGACWWDEPDGWHSAEVTEIGRRRWSPGTGSLRVFIGEPSTITLIGEIISFTPDNTITVTLNNKVVREITFDDTHERTIDDLVLQLVAGENTIRFSSANEAGRAPGDPRDLAFSILNVEPSPESGASCAYRP
jgi:hypothetical protein